MSLPTDQQSRDLSKSQQDAAIAGTYAARPGTKNTTPAGLGSANEDPSAAPFVQAGPPSTTGELREQLPNREQVRQQVPSTQQAQSSVQGTLDSAYQQLPSTQSIKGSTQSGAQSVSQQLPSTQSITEQLPSATGVLNSITQGVNYVAEGVKDLAIGSNDATASTTGIETSTPQNVVREQVRHPDGTNVVKEQFQHQDGTEVLKEKINHPGRETANSTAQQSYNIPGGFPSDEPVQDSLLPHQPLRREPDAEESDIPGKSVDKVSGQSQAPPAHRKEDILPAHGQSNTLPEYEQDAALSGSRAARPGVSSGEARHDVPPETSANLPAGVTEGQHGTSRTAKTADTSVGYENPTLANFNQQAKDTVVGGAQAVYNQLPSAQAIQQTVTGGVNAVYQQTPSVEAVKQTTQTGAQTVGNQLPSGQTVRETANNNAQYATESARGGAQSVSSGTQSIAGTVQSGVYSAEEQVMQGAQSVLGTVQSGLGYVKDTVVGHQQAQDSDRIHKDGTDYIKEQLDGRSTSTQRPLHAGAASGIPRDTVESSAEPDVSYEHRPKTLPKSELLAREANRSAGEHGFGAPERVTASRRNVQWAPEATASGEAVHEKSEVERELLSKVEPAPPSVEAIASSGGPGYNVSGPISGHGVKEVGNWGSEAAHIPGTSATKTTGITESSYPHIGTAQRELSGAGADFVPGSSSHLAKENAEPLHIHGVSNVDLTAGVHNGVVGAGSHVPGQDPAYPQVGTAQVGNRPNQSESIPPVIVPHAGPEPGKGVAPVGDVDLDAGFKNSVVGAGSEQSNQSHAQSLPSGGERTARAGSINPRETHTGEALSAPPIPSDDVSSVGEQRLL